MKLPVVQVNRDKVWIVDSEEAARRFKEVLPRASSAAIDSETSGINRMTDRIYTIQMHWGEKPAIIFEPYIHILGPWIKDKKPWGKFFNAKFEMWMFENHGIPWLGPVEDSNVTDWLVDENVKNADLKTRVHTVLGKPSRPSWNKLFPRMNAQQAYEAHPQLFLDYSIADAVDTWEFAANRQAELEKLPWHKDDSMWDYFTQIEMPTTKVLYKMERRGVRIDVDFLEEAEEQAKKTLEKLERRFYRIAGKEINLRSPDQLKKLFYQEMKYPVQYSIKKTPGGGREKIVSTDADCLERLAQHGAPLAKILLEYRSIETLKKTFITGILERVDTQDRIHTSIVQAFALTGRFSSRDPNVQNIPRKANDRFGIRTAFIASEGMLLGGADYSQIETRLMAHMSGDPNMIKACENSDLYAGMGCNMFHVDIDHFKKDANGNRSPEAEEHRQQSKAITLGLGFGKQAKSIAQDLKITEEEAQNLFNIFFDGFPVLKTYMDRQIQNCRRDGYVRTMLGRYRRIPDIYSQKFWHRSHAERQALNSPIQGSALDMMKKAMLNIDASGVLEKHQAHLLMTVHDELIFEAPKDRIKALMADVVPMMKQPFNKPLRVKIDVSPYIAQSWGEGK